LSREQWFRNAKWDDQTAAQFETKLKRARNKGQYLRIQASTLRETNPKVALALLDRYFQQAEDNLDDALAYVDQAVAYFVLGRVDETVRAYENALITEEKTPHTLTGAYLDLPYTICVSGLSSLYGRALELLEKHRARLTFPVEHFMWNAAQAIIAHNVGEQARAREFAAAGIQAASSDHSGFRYHPQLGLFSEKQTEMLSLLKGY